jgi:hypothetical protein
MICDRYGNPEKHVKIVLRTDQEKLLWAATVSAFIVRSLADRAIKTARAGFSGVCLSGSAMEDMVKEGEIVARKTIEAIRRMNGEPE